VLSFGTYYWYGRGSDVLAETDLSGVWKRVYICLNGSQVARHDPGSNWFCYFADHLGSSRVVTNATGTILDDSDFYPFGGERAVASGAGSSAGTPQGVRHPFGGERVVAAGSGNTYKFTGKERDSESGLDYFGARYYTSTLGKFVTPDPLMARAHVSNPQTWNRYSYTLNKPLRFVAPDGLEPNPCQKDADSCTATVKVNVIYDKDANNGKGLTDQQKKKFEKELLAKAQKEFGKSDIKLDVAYTQSSLNVSEQGVTVSGLQAGAVNVVVTDRLPLDLAPQGQAGVASKAGDFYTIGIGIAQDGKGLLAHELGHQFLGHPDRQLSKDFFFANLQYMVGEVSVDIRRLGQSIGIRQDAFREGAKKFSVPPDQKANEPRKQ
jgi:RHS repeat-associated protein